MSMFSTRNGLYERARKKFKVQDGIKLFTYSFYRQRREEVQAFFAQIYSEAQASRAATGHHAMTQLLQMGALQRHYTLNIDGLSEVVGMDTWHHDRNPQGSTVEMHGNIRQLVCPTCHEVESLSRHNINLMRAQQPVPCTACGQDQLRFKVMLYDDGEGDCITPEHVFDVLEEDLKVCDMVVWAGISFQQSASVEYFRRVRHMLGTLGRLNAVPQILVNPSEEPYFNLLSAMSNPNELQLLDLRATSDVAFPAMAQRIHAAILREEPEYDGADANLGDLRGCGSADSHITNAASTADAVAEASPDAAVATKVGTAREARVGNVPSSITWGTDLWPMRSDLGCKLEMSVLSNMTLETGSAASTDPAMMTAATTSKSVLAGMSTKGDHTGSSTGTSNGVLASSGVTASNGVVAGSEVTLVEVNRCGGLGGTPMDLATSGSVPELQPKWFRTCWQATQVVKLAGEADEGGVAEPLFIDNADDEDYVEGVEEEEGRCRRNCRTRSKARGAAACGRGRDRGRGRVSRARTESRSDSYGRELSCISLVPEAPKPLQTSLIGLIDLQPRTGLLVTGTSASSLLPLAKPDLRLALSSLRQQQPLQLFKPPQPLLPTPQQQQAVQQLQQLLQFQQLAQQRQQQQEQQQLMQQQLGALELMHRLRILQQLQAVQQLQPAQLLPLLQASGTNLTVPQQDQQLQPMQLLGCTFPLSTVLNLVPGESQKQLIGSDQQRDAQPLHRPEVQAKGQCLAELQQCGVQRQGMISASQPSQLALGECGHTTPAVAHMPIPPMPALLAAHWGLLNESFKGIGMGCSSGGSELVVVRDSYVMPGEEFQVAALHPNTEHSAHLGVAQGQNLYLTGDMHCPVALRTGTALGVQDSGGGINAPVHT